MQDRRFTAKLLRPLVSGDFFQPRLAVADRRLQQNTLPPLEKSRWNPENKETGTPGVDNYPSKTSENIDDPGQLAEPGNEGLPQAKKKARQVRRHNERRHGRNYSSKQQHVRG